MKISKRQLKQIIREEKRRILRESQEHAVFSPDAMYDILATEIEDYALNNGSPSESISSGEFEAIQQAIAGALEKIGSELVGKGLDEEDEYKW